MIKNMRISKKGFTLIELVVVIAVLAVLAAIAIPVVTGVLNDAKAHVDDANANTIEASVKLYATQEDLTTVDASDIAAALEAGGIDTGIAPQQDGKAFIVNSETLVVTVDNIPTSGDSVDNYDNVYVK